MASELPPTVEFSSDDALDASLEALKGSASASGTNPGSVALQRLAGCKRLIELLHNQPAHKLEALERGVIPILRTVFEDQPVDADLMLHASRAVRSLAFKNDRGRDEIHSSGIIPAVVAALLSCVGRLEAAPSLLPAGAEIGVDGVSVLGAIEEATLALTAVCSRHGETWLLFFITHAVLGIYSRTPL